MGLAEQLRLDADMLKDGYQRNLTELWHSEVVRDAAKDCEQAADQIERLTAALGKLEEAADSMLHSTPIYPSMRREPFDRLREAMLEARVTLGGNNAQ